jgi:hypothetical protein
VLHVAIRAWRGLPAAPVPWPVKVHVALAFANMIAAILLGMLAGLNRAVGFLAWSSLSAAFAHAHLAAVGWAVMMVIGLSYRLVPMILPASMPTGSSMVWSAVLLQAGVVVLTTVLLLAPAWAPVGSLLVVAGLGAFVSQVRQIVSRRLPPPAALPRPDWSTWQTHAAFLWLILAVAAGIVLALPTPSGWVVALGWFYGVAGLVGFLSQIVVGIQGRLLPLHGYYRMFQGLGLKPPARSAHSLASPALARATLLTWTLGVPLLAAGLTSATPALTSVSAAVLLTGVLCNAAQVVVVSLAKGAGVMPVRRE